MNAWTTMRFAAWRELHAHPLAIVIPPVLTILAAFQSGEPLNAWILFSLLLSTFTLWWLAARGDGSADAFWRGLGGPHWARLAGAWMAHAPVPASLVVLALMREGSDPVAQPARREVGLLLTLLVIAVWAGTSGYLDDVPIEDIGRFEDEFLDRVQRSHSGIYDTIRETGAVSEDTITALKDAIEDFRRSFETTSSGLLVSEEPGEDVDEEDVEQETVKKRVQAPQKKEGGS